MSQTSRLAFAGALQASFEDSRPVDIVTIPTGVPPNGTVAADGTITLVAALRIAYPHCWMYLPAGAVSGGSAGMYYVRMSSTTVGQVFTNYFNASTTEFMPIIPEGSPVLAIGSGVAYTQTTGTTLSILNKTLKGNVLGIYGHVRAKVIYSVSNNANSKVSRLTLNGTTFWSASVTTTGSQAATAGFSNKGLLTSQIALLGQNGDIGAGGVFVDMTHNTALDLPINATGQIAVATTDYMFLEFASFEVFSQD